NRTRIGVAAFDKGLPLPASRALIRVLFEALRATYLVAGLIFVGFLAGCATTPMPGRSGPVSNVPAESRVPPPRRNGRYQPPEVTAYREPATPKYSRPEPARAVQALSRRAEDQRASGQLVAAAASLERALRIEPKNAVLWNRLAHVRYEQKQYALASSLAAKSNAFAGQDQALRADNNKLISRSR
ncbi:tetratricopeptide repeat protein, partial [Thiolapillus sp.]